METHPGFILAATRTFIFIIRLININNVDIIIVYNNISFCVSHTNFMSVTPGFPHMLIVVSNAGVTFPVTITGQCPPPPSPPIPCPPLLTYMILHTNSSAELARPGGYRCRPSREAKENLQQNRRQKRF